MPERKDIQEAYDKISTTYSTQLGSNTPEKQEEIIEEFSSRVQGLVLDVGCGPTPFKSTRTKTVGLDFSRGQLNEAPTNSNIVQGDMSQLPFYENTFDGIVAFYSLIHLPLQDHQDAWFEFNRVLKDGGIALITEGDSQWEGSQEDWIGSGKKMSWNIAGKEKRKNI